MQTRSAWGLHGARSGGPAWNRPWNTSAPPMRLRGASAGAALPQDAVDLGVHPVVRDDFAEGVLPLADALTRNTELISDLLTALTSREGPEEPTETDRPCFLMKLRATRSRLLGEATDMVLSWFRGRESPGTHDGTVLPRERGHPDGSRVRPAAAMLGSDPTRQSFVETIGVPRAHDLDDCE